MKKNILAVCIYFLFLHNFSSFLANNIYLALFLLFFNSFIQAAKKKLEIQIFVLFLRCCNINLINYNYIFSCKANECCVIFSQTNRKKIKKLTVLTTIYYFFHYCYYCNKNQF